jgi:serine/threonine-protein kinase
MRSKSESISERPSATPTEGATWIGERRDGHTAPTEPIEGSDVKAATTEPIEGSDVKAATIELTENDDAPVSVAGAHEIDAGRTIDGRYRVEELLGEGAVGLVYKCRHLVLDKDVAIKVLRPDFARDPELSGRLVLEAKAASAIGNPHIVETVDFGTLLDGTAFFAMEYLDGVPLTELLAADEPMSRDDLLHISIQMAEALEAAHAAEIVHRDLKPDNVFIVARRGDPRFVKIVDFGIAKLARAESKLTRAGQIYGTPHYMSPEQASGRPTDARTDVYALGVILFEMATGSVPFDAEEPLGILSLHLHEEPQALSERASAKHMALARMEGLDVVVRKCLAKEPSDRYASMFELRADLCRLQSDLPPVAVATFRSEAKPDRRKAGFFDGMSAATRGAYAVAGLGIMVSAALGYALYEKSGAPVPVPSAPAPRIASPPQAASPENPVTSAPAAPSAPSEKGRSATVIVIPHDATILRGKENIGPMPVTIDVPDGKAVHLAISRRGYVSRRLTVDGSRSRVVVGLVPERTVQGKKGRASKEAEAKADEAAAKMVETDDVGFTLENQDDTKPKAPSAGAAEAVGETEATAPSTPSAAPQEASPEKTETAPAPAVSATPETPPAG